MKVLQLCKKIPYPVRDGESLAIDHLGRSLAGAGVVLDMLAMNTTRHFQEMEPGARPLEADHVRHFWWEQVDNRITPPGALRSLIQGTSYHIDRFIAPAFGQKLQEILQAEHYDVIQLETVYLAPYLDLIRGHSSALVVWRAHNVEAEIWERIAGNTRFSLKRLYLEYLARKLREYELRQLALVDAVVAISDKDWRYFSGMHPGLRGGVLPIGMQPEDYPVEWSASGDPFRLGFIGSLDWWPNLEGLEWFLDEVWPAMRRAFPGMVFTIAGRNCPQRLFDRAGNGVELVGEVEEARAFIRAQDVVVVPLLSGSGMRVKILEAMALGKPVLTTSVGLEGIDARNGREVMVADTPEAMLCALAGFLQQPDRLTVMGRAARKLVEEHFDARVLGKKLAAFYRSSLTSALS